jgi:GNAT superfamily N-acetyltransferase
MQVRKVRPAEREALLAIVNDAARAYRGVIPADRWREPYMPRAELEAEIADGVEFWGAEEQGRLLGVMGIQDRGEVALVRHAYVATDAQGKGVGRALLGHLRGLADKPLLVGTWAAATWAIEFYRRNGFALVAEGRKDDLLRKYWSIPERQIATSVVLASNDTKPQPAEQP